MAKQDTDQGQEIARLKEILKAQGIQVEPPSIEPSDRMDYVEYGSDRHADLLGLRKATEDDKLVKDGWTLADMTMFGPQATDDYMREVLRQKISELTTAPPAPQSADMRKPGFAPPMWRPSPMEAEVSGIV
jgi:hypothetical protein